jgi:UDP-N-acetylmuramoyl-tripeptide--D-alanyl-D-alanine ligase
VWFPASTILSRRRATVFPDRLFTAEEVARATGASRPAAGETFTSVSTDTRTLAPGALYVALKADRFDGHAFVAEATSKGAAGAIVRRGTLAVAGLPLFEVDDIHPGIREKKDWFLEPKPPSG